MGQSRVVNRQFKFRAFKNCKVELGKKRCKKRLRRVRKGNMTARSYYKPRVNKMMFSYKLKRGYAGSRQLKNVLFREEGIVGRKKRTRRLSDRLSRDIEENIGEMDVAQMQMDTEPPSSELSNLDAPQSVIEVQPVSTCASTITLCSLEEDMNEDEIESDVELQKVNCNVPIKEDEDIVVIAHPRSRPTSSWSSTTKQEEQYLTIEEDSPDTVRFPQNGCPNKWHAAVVPQRDRPQSPLLVHLSTHLTCAFRTARALSTIKLPPPQKEINCFDTDITLDDTLTDLELDPLDDDETSTSFGCEKCMEQYWQDLASLADVYGIFPLEKNIFDNLQLMK